MEYLVLGFFTGLSLILAIGAQNIFVIEQGLKKQYVFLVCFVCSISDLLLVFCGIFIFHFFKQYFNSTIELTFNIILIFFLINFIHNKIKNFKSLLTIDKNSKKEKKLSVFLKTLGFTYLNPHVYSDHFLFLGNFSKNLTMSQKIFFGIGASISSFLFFFLIGYLSSYFSQYVSSKKIWKIINLFIIIFMIFLIILILIDIIN